MNDSKTTIAEIKQLVDTFVAERDWDQYHDAQNISMNLSIEANELMELFV